MILDANLLLFAVDERSRFHNPARAWLTELLNGTARVGLPWITLGAFLRISTHPRAFEAPLSAAQAADLVASWLESPVTWIAAPGAGYWEILRALLNEHDLRGNLVTDAQLAALAIEHGMAICSADTEFARFPEVRWINPLAG